jgi:hypothetical protein
MRVWPQDEHENLYASSLLEHVDAVLSKSEGPAVQICTLLLVQLMSEQPDNSLNRYWRGLGW